MSQAQDPPARRRPQTSIVENYEGCLREHGDSFRGVGWTRSQEETDWRYAVMLGVVRDRSRTVSLLDFGCGLSHLYQYVLANGLEGIEYSGADLSQQFLERSRAKYPDRPYHLLDVLESPDELPSFDYVVANGVFTQKLDNTQDEMWEYFTELVGVLFAKAEIGLAFNVMSKQVDWERDDLFHVPFDVLATFLSTEVSRHFVIRHDYGLHEYTVYVYHQPDR